MLENLILSALSIIPGTPSNSPQNYDSLKPSYSFEAKQNPRDSIDALILRLMGKNSHEIIKSDVLNITGIYLAKASLQDSLIVPYSLIRSIRKNYNQRVKRIYRFEDIGDSTLINLKGEINYFLKDEDITSKVFFFHVTDTEKIEERKVDILIRMGYTPMETPEKIENLRNLGFRIEDMNERRFIKYYFTLPISVLKESLSIPIPTD